jgi:O-antigen/teichoic acid export membrane protein
VTAPAPGAVGGPGSGLLRAALTLLAGGALAQVLPLLLGPWLTRLYSPEAFGAFHLFAAVAINLSVIACARYEFALPLAADAAEADGLRRLCLRLLAGVTVLSAGGGVAWAVASGQGSALWLGPAVGVGGALSLATLWATRTQRFRALAVARVMQYGGASLAQVVAGLLQGGVHGLIAGPVLAQAVAVGWLMRRPGRPAPPLGLPAAPEAVPDMPSPSLRAVARRWREFPLLNTPHAFLGALQDTVTLALVAATLGPAAAGFWGLALRYLKAPASLVGAAVSQALYPKLAEAGASTGTGPTRAARAAVRRVMGLLALVALPLVLGLWMAGPWAFERLFGPDWREAGVLARALAVYIGLHFVASPLAVVTMAWGAQAWALRWALVGQVLFVAALGLGLHLGGLTGAGWAVSAAMGGYFGWYFWRLAHWPLGTVLVAVVQGRPQGAGDNPSP